MIVLFIIIAVFAAVLFIPIRIFVSYHLSLRLWIRVLFFRFDVFPRNRKKSVSEPVKIKEASPPPKAASQQAPPKAEKQPFEHKSESSTKERPKNKPKSETPEKGNYTDEENKESLVDKLLGYYELFCQFFDPFRRLLRRLFKLETLGVKITVGASDAADTAVYTGMLWAAAYNILGLIARFVTIEKHDISIEPSFNAPALTAQADCIICTCAANIIGAAAIAAIAYLKYKIKARKQGGTKK